MNCPRSRNDLASVHYAGRNHILLPRFNGNALSVDEQRVAALHDEHVLVELMGMLSLA